jgi:hypothetical protein
MKALLNKLKSMPAITLFAIFACWYLRWTQGLFPNGWDAVPLLVGMFAGWLLLRPAQSPSATQKKWCKWLDHQYEFVKTTDKGLTADEYICKRCGDPQIENGWVDPLPGMSWRRKLVISLGAVVVLAACALPPLAKDAETYLDVVAEKGCCDFVSENWIARPVTRALVEWENPYWSVNKEKSERWLISAGIVGGEAKFLRVLQREPITNAQP